MVRAETAQIRASAEPSPRLAARSRSFERHELEMTIEQLVGRRTRARLSVLVALAGEPTHDLVSFRCCLGPAGAIPLR